MSRLIDRLTTDAPLIRPTPTGFSPGDERFRTFLRAGLDEDLLPVVVIDNVAAYLFGGTDQERWEYRRDFPCLAPPWPVCWMETKRPATIVSETYGRLAGTGLPYAWGALVVADDLHDPVRVAPHPGRIVATLGPAVDPIAATWTDHRPAILRAVARHDESPAGRAAAWDRLAADQREAWLFGYAYERLVGAATLPPPGPARWALAVDLYAEVEKHGAIVGPLRSWCFLIDEAGACLRTPLTLTALPPDVAAQGLIFPMLLALSFCHCRNVRQVPVELPPGLVRAHRKRTGRPLVRFTTLEIQPMQEILRREGRAAEVGLQRALSICRGHFKTFSPDRPLFGRHVGRYWWGAQVRGRARDGRVVKDYAIEPPR